MSTGASDECGEITAVGELEQQLRPTRQRARHQADNVRAAGRRLEHLPFMPQAKNQVFPRRAHFGEALQREASVIPVVHFQDLDGTRGGDRTHYGQVRENNLVTRVVSNLHR